MRYSTWHRFLIGLWAVWFSTVLIEPAGIFACAMHSEMTGANASPASATPHLEHGAAEHGAAEHGAAEHGAAEHGAAAVTATHATIPPVEHAGPEHQGHPCCTCLGQCCTMTVAVIPPVDITIDEVLSRQASLKAAIVLTRTPLRPAHALPFANGPPTTARA